MTDQIRCDLCWYAVLKNDAPDMVECHKNPPVATGGLHCEVFTHWPTVEPSNFCGEFRRTAPPVGGDSK